MPPGPKPRKNHYNVPPVFAAPRTQLALIRDYLSHSIEYRRMNGKNNANSQEKATMRSSKLPIHWCKRESQLMPVKATRLKIVARTRKARDSGFCERAKQDLGQCREVHHCNKSDQKPTFSHKLSSLDFNASWLVNKCRVVAWFPLRSYRAL
jgi:hypothetical protein